MITLTESAVDALREILDTSQAPADQGIRLVMQGPGQLGLAIDGPHDGDQVVESEGRTVFLVDQSLASALDGAVVDCRAMDDGSKQLTVGMEENAA
ncbi:MAG: adhesin [Chloroflexota bacterium]|nr:MAG: adhesin [Chloroflexota bacterium]